MRTISKYRVCIFAGIISLTIFGLNVNGQKTDGVLLIRYCDLLKSPQLYDGKIVKIHATYRYGFEWSEIYCLECRDLGRIWLEIGDISKKAENLLKKFPKDDGTINGVFTGLFQSSNGPFGDGSYRFRVLLSEIDKPELVSKSGSDPTQLSETVKKKVCND